MRAMAACFDPASCIFTSPRAPLSLPSIPDMVSFLFSITAERNLHHRLAIADVATQQSFTFLQLWRRIQSVACALSFLGIIQQDVVLIVVPNSVDVPVIFLAILSLGAVATMANPMNAPNDILKQAQDCKPKLTIAVCDVARKLCNFEVPILLIDERDSLPASLECACPIMILSEIVKQSSHHMPVHVKICPTDPAALLYTSGTAGASKGAIISHKNLIAAALQVRIGADMHTDAGGLTFLCLVPMFHVFGLITILLAQLSAGNTVMVMARYHLVHMLKAVEKYGITHLSIAAPVMVALARHETLRNYNLSSVTEVICGTGHVGEETMEIVREHLNNAFVRRAYGMTEATGRIAISARHASRSSPASVGPLISGMEAVVVDPSSGIRLPPYARGELWVRGPNVMQGYHNNKEATDTALDKDRWLHTGDLVHFDNEGNLFIVGRLKELIKYKGFQVAPVELETLLMSHHEIVDAAVVPFPDTYAGEVPLAFVVPAVGSSLREQDVVKFVEGQVAPYKKIRKVKFVSNLPKTSTGKVIRHKLVLQAMSKL